MLSVPHFFWSYYIAICVVRQFMVMLYDNHHLRIVQLVVFYRLFYSKKDTQIIKKMILKILRIVKVIHGSSNQHTPLIVSTIDMQLFYPLIISMIDIWHALVRHYNCPTTLTYIMHSMPFKLASFKVIFNHMQSSISHKKK